MSSSRPSSPAQAENVLGSSNVPMLGNIPEPGDTGGFEGDGGVETASDGAVDDGRLLLIEQPDHLPLSPDCPLQPSVSPVHEPHNRRLLAQKWKWKEQTPQLVGIDVLDGRAPSHLGLLVCRWATVHGVSEKRC